MRAPVFALVLAAAAPAAAQTPSGDSLFCKFDRLCSSEGCDASDYFLELRVDAGEAYFNDGERTAEVDLIPGKDGLSFLDIDDDGNLSLTTVYQDLTAAHSAHGIGEDGPASILRLGACQEEHG
ncbi:MAG: hypothetical protein AAGI51_10215 [Pseudomonadota bacterium]